MPTTDYELPYWKELSLVAGVDEAGRGAIAGPVFASAVILPLNFINKYGINDSKQISAKKRNKLYEIIKNEAVSYSIQSVSNDIIDEINILQASIMAMNIAIDNLNYKPKQLLIDGNYFKNTKIPFTTIIKGDSKCISIAAASILAKVARDNFMIEIADKNFPNYKFNSHKGYGVKLHFKKIEEYGICNLHRQSFLKKFNLRQINAKLF